MVLLIPPHIELTSLFSPSIIFPFREIYKVSTREFSLSPPRRPLRTFPLSPIVKNKSFSPSPFLGPCSPPRRKASFYSRYAKWLSFPLYTLFSSPFSHQRARYPFFPIKVNFLGPPLETDVLPLFPFPFPPLRTQCSRTLTRSGF